jgi:hypothetical protein
MAQDFAFAIYGGSLTENSWEQSLVPGVEIADAMIVVVAASWTFCRLFKENVSLELEAQLGKHYGDQNHWEINLPVLGIRWHRFPWDDYVDTSIAWGIGPSYATQIPEIELIRNDTSKNWLIHWFGDLSFGPPTANWEVLTRLQHRSDAFGALGGGSSNALCAGLRYRF